MARAAHARIWRPLAPFHFILIQLSYVSPFVTNRGHVQMDKVDIATEFGLPATPPKLLLSSFPSSAKRFDSPAGSATPPIRTAGSIPFKWEDSPGRPRLIKPALISPRSPAVGGGKHLGLPPRLAAPAVARESRRSAGPAKIIGGHSYFFIRRSSSLPSGKERNSGGNSKRVIIKWDVMNSERKWPTGDTPNSSTSASSSSDLKSSSSVSGSSSYSFDTGGGSVDGDAEDEQESRDQGVRREQGVKEETRVRILRYNVKRRTLTCVASYTASRLWGRIFGRLKQAAVPCLRDPKT